MASLFVISVRMRTLAKDLCCPAKIGVPRLKLSAARPNCGLLESPIFFHLFRKNVVNVFCVNSSWYA